jgi:adenylate cyclase
MALGVYLVGGGYRAGLHLSGLLLGPFPALITLLVTELLLRRGIPLLFPRGGVKDFQGRWTLSLTKRLVLSLLLMGPLTLMGTSILMLAVIHDSLNVEESLHRLMPVLAYVMVMSVGLFVSLIAISSRGFLGPIRRIAAAMDAIAEGDLDIHVPIETGDVLGILGEHLNDMVNRLRERFHLEAAFGKFVDPSLAAHAASGNMRIEGKRQTLSVMFTDVRNFTALSEVQEPTALVDCLNRYFEAMVPCVTRHGGSLNKFLGDGIMALFGAPGPVADHAEAAVRASLDMVEALKGFNRDQRERGLPEFAIGIGISTGTVIIGNIGSSERLEFTAIGDTVNTASRLEGLTKSMGATILVDAETRAGVGDSLRMEYLGHTSVRGKVNALEVFTLPGMRTAISGASTEPL